MQKSKFFLWNYFYLERKSYFTKPKKYLYRSWIKELLQRVKQQKKNAWSVNMGAESNNNFKNIDRERWKYWTMESEQS